MDAQLVRDITLQDFAGQPIEDETVTEFRRSQAGELDAIFSHLEPAVLAKKLGITERTFEDWRKTDAFKRGRSAARLRLTGERSAIADEAANYLASRALAHVEELDRLATDAKSENVRARVLIRTLESAGVLKAAADKQAHGVSFQHSLFVTVQPGTTVRAQAETRIIDNGQGE